MQPPKPPPPPAQDPEDSIVDFSNASLYVAGIQTVFAICTCACVSVLSVLARAVGRRLGGAHARALQRPRAAALMYAAAAASASAHGVTVVFAALQLAVPLYLGTLVVAQLVHTCSLRRVARAQRGGTSSSTAP